MAVRTILMTADTVGGVWTYAIQLTQALAQHGIVVNLATMGAPLTAAQEEQARACGNLRVFASAYRLEWMDDPWCDVTRAGEWLLQLERELQPDIVHLNGYAHGALPWRSPVIMVAHSCVLSWWRAVRGGEAPSEWDRYREAVTRGLRAAGLVVAPTASMLAEISRYYGSIRRTCVIANGRERLSGKPSARRDLIFAAGRLWDEAKNLAALDKVAPRLSWPVYVAGDARHPDGGTARPYNVRALGPLAPADLGSWLNAASIYALPARYEPFGLSVLEAAMCGCTLVLGDIASLREVWGDAAVFVPPNDHSALEAALKGLMANPARRAELSERAQIQAQLFAPQRMASNYVNAYTDLQNG